MSNDQQPFIPEIWSTKTLEAVKQGSVMSQLLGVGQPTDMRCAEDRTIDELRAVLAPLLDDSVRMVERSMDGDAVYGCIVCNYSHSYDPERDDLHARTCPVLRKDELLGRGLDTVA